MTKRQIKVSLAGIGKIARDQHIPALLASFEWDLAATISSTVYLPGIEAFREMRSFLERRPDITVVSLCAPPRPRFEMAKMALLAGRHVMLEKPPGSTVSEVQILRDLASARGLSLYASWHSRAAFGVKAAREWLASRQVIAARITWREDVRRWHPGQDWIFEPGGMGVFDPGINALSILTEILPMQLRLCDAELDVPINRSQPIAARLRFDGNIEADFDWRQTGPQIWDIVVQTDRGEMALRHGGNLLEVDGRPLSGGADQHGEYPALYAHMAKLVRDGRSDVDVRPLELVADAFLLARRKTVEAFVF